MLEKGEKKKRRARSLVKTVSRCSLGVDSQGGRSETGRFASNMAPLFHLDAFFRFSPILNFHTDSDVNELFYYSNKRRTFPYSLFLSKNTFRKISFWMKFENY